nr:hypothetical protein [Tanacetum cinerariifolium]
TMDTTIDQQVAMDEALVPHAQRLRIGRSNFCLLSNIKSKESTLQLEFWATASVHHHAIRFKMDNKKHIVNLESFKDMLHICPRVHGQSFDEPPLEEEILAFIRFLGHSAAIRTLTDVNINKFYQPWRSFVAIINKCLSGKSSGYDSLRLSKAQILWGLYRKRNVDYAYLIWEDFVYQVKHKNSKKSNEMYYPRFTKIIIHNFMSKDPSIPRRNKVNWHYVRDDHMFSTIKLRTRSSSNTTITPPTAAGGPRLTTAQKGKQAAKASKAKCLSALSEVAMTEAQHLKLVTKKSLQQTHISQASGSYADEGTGSILGVLDDGDGEEEDDGDDGEEGDGDNNDEDDDGEEGDDDDDDDQEVVRDDDKDDEKDDEEEVRVAVQLQFDKLCEEAQKENDKFLRTIDENMQTIIKEQVKEQVKTSYPVDADLSEIELKKILIEKIEGNKSIQRSDEQRKLYKALVEAYESDKIILDTYGETVTLKRWRDDDANKDKEPFAGPDQGSKRCREGKEPESASAPSKTATRSADRSTQGSQSRQTSASESAFAEEPMQTTCQMEEPSHPEFDTGAKDQPLVQSSQHPEWFSQQQKPPSSDHDWNKTVDTLTPELLAGPTYDLMKGSCKSLLELEYHLEEVFKATTNQLDWVNPEGQQCLKPKMYYFYHEEEGSRLRAYQGRKRQQFYGFAVNRESARDVYSKTRIIAVTELKIVEWHNYKHFDWITVQRDDDKLYKFKEGDFKRLRIQDIEDMLLLLVQGKLTNLTVEERFAFNVSLRFTRSIVIQRRVEDLQLGVKSYQKKLNLTRPDSYRFDLKRKEAYTAYSNPRGFIYQNKNKKNRLMRIDELHKFSDGTLTDVRTALDDRLKRIRMQYLPQSIWRKSDKDRAAAMI